jgi:opacity protein-like surface antigen
MTKKITTICCAVALLATTAATPALSQSKNFAGPSIAVHTGYTGTDTKMTFDTAGYLSYGENDVTYGADLAYSFPVDNNFLISVGATYDFDKIKAGSLNADPDTIKLSIKDHYSFYIEPTYAFNNSTALFAKLGYHQAKGSVNVALFDEDGDPSDSASGSKNFKGWGYGFGIKTFLNNNVFVKAEASLVEYDKETFGSGDDIVGFEPQTVSGLISIGYKF